jgi:hypothetical protein
MFTPIQLMWATHDNKFKPDNFYRKCTAWRQRLYHLTAEWKKFLNNKKYNPDSLPSGVTIHDIIDQFRFYLHPKESGTARKNANSNEWFPSGWLLFHMCGPVAPHYGCQVAVFIAQESMVPDVIPVSVIKEEKKVGRSKKTRPANAEIIDLERQESFLNFNQQKLEELASIDRTLLTRLTLLKESGFNGDVYTEKVQELNEEYNANRYEVQERYALMTSEFSPSPKKRRIPSTPETTIDLVNNHSEEVEDDSPAKVKPSFASLGFNVKIEPK